jgi:hypothetical protein
MRTLRGAVEPLGCIVPSSTGGTSVSARLSAKRTPRSSNRRLRSAESIGTIGDGGCRPSGLPVGEREALVTGSPET